MGTGQATNRQKIGGTGQATNRQKIGGTGQATNRQKIGGTGQATNRQKLGEQAKRPIDKNWEQAKCPIDKNWELAKRPIDKKLGNRPSAQSTKIACSLARGMLGPAAEPSSVNALSLPCTPCSREMSSRGRCEDHHRRLRCRWLPYRLGTRKG
ncbi:MAG: hypothetical protein RBU37_27995 [Myxococcota bacterium]|nr:hypothetical protein [Myxococcota bacterium]